jgi:polar amino acid transport system permease protein
MRVIVPPMGNETVTMLKSTALVSVIGGKDLLTAVQSVYAQNYQVIPLLVVAVIWYLALTSVLSVGQYFVERRYGKGHGNASMSRRWLGLGVTR